MLKEPINEQSSDTYYGVKVTGALKLRTKKEKVDDLAWVPDTHNQILAVTEKMIRIYDIGRVEEDIGHVALKKEKGSFSEVSFNPNNPKQFLINYGNEVTLWDLASLKEPVLSFKNYLDNSGVSTMHIEWIENEPGLIASAFSGKTAEPVVSFWYLKESLIKKEKTIRPIKDKYMNEGEPISSFTVAPNTLDLLIVLNSVIKGIIYRVQFLIIPTNWWNIQ